MATSICSCSQVHQGHICKSEEWPKDSDVTVVEMDMSHKESTGHSELQLFSNSELQASHVLNGANN